MSRPSGECEGQPCYTQADRDAIDAELSAQDAIVEAKQAQLDAAKAIQMALQIEKMMSEVNQCAC